jgi:hypothetical protein
MAEIVVAVLILGTMVVSLYGGLSSGFSIVQSSREDLRATQILLREMETLRVCSWGQLCNRTFQDSYDPGATVTGAGGTLYSGTVSTNSPDAVPDTAPYKNDMRVVTVTVQWTNYSGNLPVLRSRQMQTHVARYGLQNYSWEGSP